MSCRVPIALVILAAIPAGLIAQPDKPLPNTLIGEDKRARDELDVADQLIKEKRWDDAIRRAEELSISPFPDNWESRRRRNLSESKPRASSSATSSAPARTVPFKNCTTPIRLAADMGDSSRAIDPIQHYRMHVD